MRGNSEVLKRMKRLKGCGNFAALFGLVGKVSLSLVGFVDVDVPEAGVAAAGDEVYGLGVGQEPATGADPSTSPFDGAQDFAQDRGWGAVQR